MFSKYYMAFLSPLCNLSYVGYWILVEGKRQCETLHYNFIKCVRDSLDICVISAIVK